MTRVDTANDLSQILLVIVGTVGSIGALLFLLAAIEPQTTRSRAARPNRDRLPARQRQGPGPSPVATADLRPDLT